VNGLVLQRATPTLFGKPQAWCLPRCVLRDARFPLCPAWTRAYQSRTKQPRMAIRYLGMTARGGPGCFHRRLHRVPACNPMRKHGESHIDRQRRPDPRIAGTSARDARRKPANAHGARHRSWQSWRTLAKHSAAIFLSNRPGPTHKQRLGAAGLLQCSIRRGVCQIEHRVRAPRSWLNHSRLYGCGAANCFNLDVNADPDLVVHQLLQVNRFEDLGHALME